MSARLRPTSGSSDDPVARMFSEVHAVLDRGGAVREASPGWDRLLGWTGDQLEGRGIEVLAHVDDRAAAQRLVAALAAGRDVHDLDLRLRHRTDAYRWVRVQAAPHPGAHLGYLVARDITEQHRDRAARELLEQQARVGTWELDLGSGRAVWSAMTHELFGTDPANHVVSVEAALARFPAGARASLEAAFELLSTSGEPYDLELPLLAGDGAEHRMRAVGRAVRRDDVVVRVHGTFEDVTERVARQREQAELVRTKALLEESQRLARLGHWEGDLELDQTLWSPVVHEIFGLDPDEPTPALEQLQALVHPDDRDRFRAASEQLRREGEQTVDYRIRRPDGQVRSVRQVARLSGAPGGPDTRVVGTVQDVTELRQVEQALRDSREQLQRVLAATNDGWWDLDIARGTSFYSERWWALCGYVPGELPDDPEPWRQLTHPDDLVRFEAEFRAILESGARTFVVPSAGLHRDGRRIPMMVRALIDRDDHGTPVRISGATADVTEARQAELAKEAFLSTVSHELRTPLTAIGGALELLTLGVVGALPDEVEELVEVARRNTVRLRLLIDDLLDLEHLAEGQSFHHQPQLLAPLLVRAVADNAPYATVRGVRFVLHPGDEQVRVDVDRSRIDQVLANLLSNAAKFAPDETDVEVRTRPSPDLPGRIRIEVVDRGPGVPEDAQERVFERFVQADPSDPRSRGGTGLGLAISREIVERHGGRIGLDMGSGRTCFWFDLPVVAAPA